MKDLNFMITEVSCYGVDNMQLHACQIILETFIEICLQERVHSYPIHYRLCFILKSHDKLLKGKHLN